MLAMLPRSPPFAARYVCALRGVCILALALARHQTVLRFFSPFAAQGFASQLHQDLLAINRGGREGGKEGERERKKEGGGRAGRQTGRQEDRQGRQGGREGG